jgi:hypothetical protein
MLDLRAREKYNASRSSGATGSRRLELLEKGEERRLEIAKAHGLLITREEYEEKKKRLGRKHVKKDLN